jgi:hypothetical protein
MRDVESVISDQIRLRTARDQIADFPTAAFHHHDTVSPESRAQ